MWPCGMWHQCKKFVPIRGRLVRTVGRLVSSRHRRSAFASSCVNQMFCFFLASPPPTQRFCSLFLFFSPLWRSSFPGHVPLSGCIYIRIYIIYMHISNEFLMHFSLALAQCAPLCGTVWDKLSTWRHPTEGQKLFPVHSGCVCRFSACAGHCDLVLLCFIFFSVLTQKMRIRNVVPGSGQRCLSTSID